MSTTIETSSIPTTTTSSTGTSSSTSSSSLTGINMGKEDFLKLLTTQLRYQNPLSPDDPKEFVAQLAQFSSLEQLLNVNTKLDNFSTTVQSLQNSQNMAQGVSLLGKTVRAQGNSFTVTSGTASAGTVILGSDAKSVKVSISNSSGQLVRTLDLGSQSSGENQISWDGKDSSGNQVADGTYSFQVSALDSKGATVTSANLVAGTVDEVLQNSGKVYLKVNGRLVALDSIISVDQT